MVEELRSVMADRFVLSLINKKIVSGKNFTKKENGAVLMDDELRKKFLTEWQNRKKEVITHPYLREKLDIRPGLRVNIGQGALPAHREPFPTPLFP